MTTIEIYNLVEVMKLNDKWSYEVGKLKRMLTIDESPRYTYQRKKLLLQAVKIVDDGECYDIQGRNRQYLACKKENGCPVWYLHIE